MRCPIERRGRPRPPMKYQSIVFISSAGLLGFVYLILTVYSVAAASANGHIDPKRTQITFDVDSIGLGVTHGTFRSFNGQLDVDLKKPQRSSVEFFVDASSVDTGSGQLDNYIRSAFFDTANFPAMKFRSSYVRKIDDQAAEVGGDLDLHGIVRPVVLKVFVNRALGDQRRLTFVAMTTIRRSEFGMTAATPIVADEIAIRVSTEAYDPE